MMMLRGREVEGSGCGLLLLRLVGPFLRREVGTNDLKISQRNSQI
jgi:hypothetical protein